MGGRAARERGLNIRVVSIGKDRSGLFAPAVAEYVKRLGHYTKLELIELPERQGASDEAEALLGKRQRGDLLVALDERGASWSSRELASYVGKAQNQSRHLTFLVGGDEGLDPSVREAADAVLSLSKLTLPHRLARLLLIEQLYRAFTILRGEPYHK